MLIVILWAVPRRTAGLYLSPCELSLCYCCKLNNMIYGMNYVNICMSDILSCVECLVCHCIALRWGVTQVGKFHYWALLTLSREHIFQVPKTHLGMGRIQGLRSEEMAKLALSYIFVKFWTRDPVLYKLQLNIIVNKFLFV